MSGLQDEPVVNKLKKIKEEYSEDWMATLKREELESINRGLKDIEEGRVHDHQTAKNLYGKYL